MVSTLYTGEKQLAKDFATARVSTVAQTLYWDTFRQRVMGYTPAEKAAALGRDVADIYKRYEDIGPGDTHLLNVRDSKIENVPARYEAGLKDPRKTTGEMRRLEAALSSEDRAALLQEITAKFLGEVHHIVSTDPDATVIDYSFDPEALEESDRKKFIKALDDLLIPITEGSPVGFDHKNFLAPIENVLKTSTGTVIPVSGAVDIASKTGMEEGIVTQLVAGYNARRLIASCPGYLADLFLSSNAGIVTDSLVVDGEEQEISVNLEYAQRFFRLAHIVGVKSNINSNTIDRDIVSISFFDLERVRTDVSLEAERQQIWEQLGGMAAAFELYEPVVDQEVHPLLKLLQNPYAKPHGLIGAAKSLPEYKKIFEADAGNWEGFTLGEHTETVLRNFDENFADKVPVEFLAPMRLAILSHDVGKPIAAANGEKHLQKKYNVLQADDFLTKVGVDERLKGILLAVVGEGADLAYKIDVRGAGDAAEAELETLARNTLSKFGTGDKIDGQIAGFVEMCKMLQLCDGGAYTSMATTRVEGGLYRNYPSFNRSFAPPVGLGKRDIRLREPGGLMAELDLTPSVEGPVNRLRSNSEGAQPGARRPKLN